MSDHEASEDDTGTEFCFLNSVEGSVDDDDQNEKKDDDENKMLYNPRKPKWWKNLCGKPSKAQKRSITQVMKDHELNGVPYGSFFNFDEIFSNDTSNNNNNIWLEIGFGRGENLLALAHRKQSQNIALIGAEISKTGVGMACQRIEKGINSNSYWVGYEKYKQPANDSENADNSNSNIHEYEPIQPGENPPYENLRIYQGDGAKFLPKIPSSSLSVVLITFPDPFPDKKQSQWRVIQVDTLMNFHRILKKDRGILFLATDHKGFFDWSHQVMENVNKTKQYFKEITNPSTDYRMEFLPAVSTYEQKGWNEGRTTMLAFWQTLPVTEDD